MDFYSGGGPNTTLISPILGHNFTAEPRAMKLKTCQSVNFSDTIERFFSMIGT